MSKNNKTKNNLKIYITFALVMLLCMLCGIIAGIAVGKNKESLNSIDWSSLAAHMAVSLPIVYMIMIAVLIGASVCMYYKVKWDAAKWDGEEEALIDKIERRITWLSMLSAISIGLSMMIFAICIYINESAKSVPQWSFPVSIVTCMVSIAFSCAVWKVTVDLEKKLNPEKKGNPFDFHFLRKWEDSSDEGEILIQAKACKKAFIVGQITCMFMWVISLICMIAFQTGVLPVICCCIIILSMLLANGLELVRLQK